MTYPTRDEVLAEATRCIDRAFAEGKHGIVVYVQIANAPSQDFMLATWSGEWRPELAVTTFSALLMPYLRLCYQAVPDSPLREADKIICDFAETVRQSERDEAAAN